MIPKFAILIIIITRKPRASGDDPEKAHGCLTVAA